MSSSKMTRVFSQQSQQQQQKEKERKEKKRKEKKRKETKKQREKEKMSQFDVESMAECGSSLLEYLPGATTGTHQEEEEEEEEETEEGSEKEEEQREKGAVEGVVMEEDDPQQFRTLYRDKLRQLIPTGPRHQLVARIFKRPKHCNVCGQFLWGFPMYGLSCVVCNYTVHEECEKNVPHTCRLTSLPVFFSLPEDIKPMKDEEKIIAQDYLQKRVDVFKIHHWVEGNLSQSSECLVCGELVSCVIDSMDAHRCSLCYKQVHSYCLVKEGADLGECCPRYSSLLIRTIHLTDEGNGEGEVEGKKEEEEEEREENDRPLLAFVNTKSGGQQGAVLLNKLCKHLGPCQVTDLTKHNPIKILELFREVKNLHVLVCGGDGTVSWLVSAIDTVFASKKYKPPIAILPLGTGNDLSRTLGWGGGYEGEPLSPILKNVMTAKCVEVDRWKVGTSSPASPSSSNPMLNYCSIGVDAEVVLAFHELREDSPHYFQSRFGNKVIYAAKGAMAMLESSPPLRDIITFKAGGKEVEIPPELEGIIILNLPFYAGGFDVWGQEEEEEEEEEKEEEEEEKEEGEEEKEGEEGEEEGEGAGWGLGGEIMSLFSNFGDLLFGEEEEEEEGEGGEGEGEEGGEGAGVLNASGDPLMVSRYSYRKLTPQKPKRLTASDSKIFEKQSKKELASRENFLTKHLKMAKKWKKPSVDDRLVEVVGIKSSFHMGTITMMIATGIRLFQTNDIVFTLKEGSGSIAFQVDGEPRRLNPSSSLKVNFDSPVKFLQFSFEE